MNTPLLSGVWAEKEKLMSIKKNVEREMKGLPEGRLQCRKHRNTYQYWIDGKYASKKTPGLARLVCKREYYEDILKRISELDHELEKMIQTYKDGDIDAIYHNLSQGRKELLGELVYETPEQIISRFVDSDEAIKIEDDINVKYPINTDIYSMKGENVRSKSEKIIADALYNNGVPYKYEAPLVLNNGRKDIVIHPDFTVLNKVTGKKMYIEHLGLMSDDGYYVNSINKISLYEKNGILLGKELILFHETAEQAINTNIVNEYIRVFLL